MIQNQSVSKVYGVLLALFTISVMLVVPALSASAGELYTFDPNTQKYELYDGSLHLWGTDTTGHSVLSASTGKVDPGTLRAWIGMIMAAQAMGKQTEVQYDPADGRILSVYGPK